MSCPIKIKTLEHLQKQGALGDARIVKDITKFNELNELLTNLASEKYNVLSPTNDKLFNTESKYVKNLDGSYRYVLRAEPNDKLFDVLQIAVDEYKIIPIESSNNSNILNLKNILKPVFKVEYLSNNDILNNDGSIELKIKQDSLRKEINDLNKLINCLWS